MAEVPTRQDYVEQLRRWLPAAYERYDEQTRAWRETIGDEGLFGEISTPGHPVSLAFVEAFLAVEDGDDALAARAAQRLVTLREFADEIPPDAVPEHAVYRSGVLPPQGNIFVLPYYCEAYGLLREHPCFSDADHETVQAIIADSLVPIFHFPEWGSHNRAMLRAWTLAAAAAACPAHPDRDCWQQLARQIAADSLTGWTVEDAAGYHAIWSRALFRYVDVTDQAARFYREPTARFYIDYYLNLICPLGSLADFGDSDWNPNPHLFLAIFECGARQYRDPYHRWAAAEMYRRMVARADSDTFGDPAVWVHCAQWVDESVAAVAPDWGSREVLEELAGKKVVFRSGWKPDSTFLLLNYKPETGYGRTIREYMKNTISVEAEKAHHGHSDENAISVLTSGGALLLHDGGYRETLPNGKYRADCYHARPVVRRGLLRQGDSVYDFLHDDGHHRPMETERIDFRVFDEVEFSRTRARDARGDYEHDRIIAYLKTLDLFLVIDGVRCLDVGPCSISNLFYTHEITAEGGSWFDTRLDSMRGYEPAADVDRRLLIAFLEREGLWQGHEPVQRYYRDEILMHQSTSGRGSPGDYLVFCTALIPHDGDADPEALAASVSLASVSRVGKAAAVRVRRGDDESIVGVKLDLEDAVAFADVRPRYDWESGRTRFGDWETDAHFFYGRCHGDELSWAWTEATRLELDGQTLFEGEEGTFPLQYSGPQKRDAVTKWRAFEARQRRP